MRILASPAFANEKINPYNALLYRSIEATGLETIGSEAINTKSLKHFVSEYSHTKAIFHNYDIIHFHWPDGYVNQHSVLKSIQRAIVFSFIIFISTLKGTKIVWTVHNVAPHDAYHATFSHFFMRWFVNRCDGLIFMSEASKTTFFNLYKPQVTTQYTIIPHGHYRSSYPAAIDKTLAKTQLGFPQDKKILLFCGMIKPYKNIDSLIQVFRQTKLADCDLADYDLVVAGKPDSAKLAEELQQEKGDNSHIHLLFQFIPDNQLHVYLSAADIVILPYKSILNSGALLLALSFNKPVIAPHIGAFVALQQELGLQWIYSYEGDLNPHTLAKALNQLEVLHRPAVCPLENYEWNKLAGLTLDFYQRLFSLSSTPTQPAIS